MPGSTDRVGGDDVFSMKDAVKNMKDYYRKEHFPMQLSVRQTESQRECTKRWQREILRSEKKCRLWDLAIMRQVKLLTPPLTTVAFDWGNWGEVSAETIIQMIQGKPVSRVQIIPYHLVERKSVKQAR